MTIQTIPIHTSHTILHVREALVQVVQFSHLLIRFFNVFASWIHFVHFSYGLIHVLKDKPPKDHNLSAKVMCTKCLYMHFLRDDLL